VISNLATEMTAGCGKRHLFSMSNCVMGWNENLREKLLLCFEKSV